MYLTIANLLSAEDVTRIRSKAAMLDWKDGALTAGARARSVKQNLQADMTSKAGEGLHDFLMTAISAHPVLKAAAWPRRFSRLLLSRANDSGGYGRHVDNTLMGQGSARMRTDLSFTLFLTDPEAYEGGELVIEGQGGDFSAKPAAGDLILYPSGAIHEVKPVTRGERLACVGWIESLVRDPSARETLFDLQTLRTSLAPEAPGALTLDKVIANLLRRWAEA